MSTALTVQDVKQLNAATLKLVHRKLESLPQGLGELSCLSSLDASENHIKDVLASELPPTLKELSLTGCQLSAVPRSLTALSNLQHLQLSANSITQADALFRYPYLVHASLGYNHISSICVGRSKSPARLSAPNSQPGSASSPKASGNGQYSPVKRSSQAPSAQQSSAGSIRTDSATLQQPGTAKQSPAKHGSCSPSAVPSSTGGNSTESLRSAKPSSNQALPAASSMCRSPLMSLDLSHNDVTDLPAVLSQLKQLSQLKTLSLKGNPASLLPGYHDMVLQQLPQLIYLDGQKLSGISSSSSRPGTSSTIKRRPASAASTATGTTQQALLSEAFSNLFTPSSGPAAVPILLQLHRIQLVESAERMFAELAELAAKKQQDMQLQQQAEAAAAGAAAAYNDGSTSANKSSSSSSGGKVVSSSAADVTAAAAAVPAVEVPIPPVKPISYHLQTTLPDGSQVCSTSLVIQPPVVTLDKAAPAAAEDAAATAAAAAAGKKGAKPGAKAAATAAKSESKPMSAAPGSAKGKPGAKGVRGRATVDDAVAAPPQQLVPGTLKVLLDLPVTVAGRDWMRQGFTVQLIRTQYEPNLLLQPAAGDPAADSSIAGVAVATASKVGQSAATKAPAGGKQPGAAQSIPATAADSQTALSWQYTMKQHVLGTARITAVELLENNSSPEQPQITAEGTAEFAPPAPLFDRKTGTLMLLKEAAAGLKPVGSCRYRLILHYSSPVV